MKVCFILSADSQHSTSDLFNENQMAYTKQLPYATTSSTLL